MRGDEDGLVPMTDERLKERYGDRAGRRDPPEECVQLRSCLLTYTQIEAAFDVAEAEHALWAHADRIEAVKKAMEDATDNLAYRAHREELLRLQNGDVRMLMWRRAQDARRRWAEVRP